MIFYFSGTGNSKHAADRLGAALGDKTIDMAQAVREDAYAYTLTDGEKTGFVFPVYFFGVPVVVADFVNRLKLQGGKPYIYTVVTCGADIGGADRQFAKWLEKRGLEQSAVFVLPMVDNYVLMYDVPSPAEQTAINAAADARLVQIAQSIRQNQTDGYASGVKGVLTTAALYPLYRYGRRTAKFCADDTCNGCGLCARICPRGAITMNTKKPVWTARQCAHCLGCIHRCPQQAIQYGKGTQKRRRYVHPELSDTKK